MKTKMPLAEAFEIAQELRSEIGDVCKFVVIAGSVRREKTEVGDIELVIIPRYKTVQADMFGEGGLAENQLENHLRKMASQGILTPRLKEDRRSKIAWFGKDTKDESRYIAANYQGQIGVDFFVVLPDRLDWFGWTLLLRTGPDKANRLLVTSKDKGGLKPGRLHIDDGKVFDLEDNRYLKLEREEDVFAAWGLAYVPPTRRSVEAYWEAQKS
jgi:DNA polymerase/3'-5' exonuclease PolX